MSEDETREQKRLAELRAMEDSRCDYCGAPQGYVSALKYELQSQSKMRVFNELSRLREQNAELKASLDYAHDQCSSMERILRENGLISDSPELGGAMSEFLSFVPQTPSIVAVKDDEEITIGLIRASDEGEALFETDDAGDTFTASDLRAIADELDKRNGEG